MSPPNARIQQLVGANKTFSETYTAPPTMVQIREGSEAGVLVLTCMDPRVVPEQFLGPNALVAVFRNAGGRANSDVVRTVNTMRSLIYKGKSTTIMVVHHTDCGMTHLTDAKIAEDVASRGHDSKVTDYGCFKAEDLEKSVKDDVAWLRADETMAGVDVRGYTLDTFTGLLTDLNA